MKHSIDIAWGEMQQEEDITNYKFNTEEELNAFLDGVNECLGWADYSVIGDGQTYNTIEEWRKENGKTT